MFRVSSFFGAFQALMPAIGWFVGRTIVGFISDYDHWAAFILLVIIGGRMIWESFQKEHEEECRDITRGFSLIMLSVATSIDALAVGLSFAFISINIIVACLIIGAVTFSITNLGFFTGRRVGSVFGLRAKTFGGIILIGIGLKILLTHLLGISA